jgi:hypothetical protein
MSRTLRTRPSELYTARLCLRFSSEGNCSVVDPIDMHSLTKDLSIVSQPIEALLSEGRFLLYKTEKLHYLVRESHADSTSEQLSVT